MDDEVKVLERMYDRFNARDIDEVLTALTDDVVWANGMGGGFVHGREAIRAYWTRQWSTVRSHVEPVSFHRTADGTIVAEVRQASHDLEGKPLQGQTHGLKSETVRHIFRLRNGKVARFDIQDAAYNSSYLATVNFLCPINPSQLHFPKMAAGCQGGRLDPDHGCESFRRSPLSEPFRAKQRTTPRSTASRRDRGARAHVKIALAEALS